MQQTQQIKDGSFVATVVHDRGFVVIRVNDGWHTLNDFDLNGKASGEGVYMSEGQQNKAEELAKRLAAQIK